MAGRTGSVVDINAGVGKASFNSNTGYAGANWESPDAWATAADFNAYKASQNQTPPSVQGLGPSAFGPGATGNVTSVGPTGEHTAIQTTPYNQTNQYQTGATGAPVVSTQGSATPNAYAQQQQTQLDALLQTQRDTAATTANTASMTQANDAKTAQMDHAAKLQSDAEARRLGYLSTVQGQQPNVSRGNLATNETAARNAAFARAKEQSGQTANASLKALSDVMASRGMTGSSVEGQATSDIVGGAAEGNNQFTRDQLIQDLNRSADISDQEYQGQITQRGQNLSMVPSLMGLITAGGGGLY